MALTRIIAECIFGSTREDFELSAQNEQDDKRIAADIVDTIYESEKGSLELQQKLRETIFTSSWTESLGKAVLNALEAAVRDGRAMSPALKDAYEKALEAADIVGDFVKEHPVFVTVIVLGILVLLMPWVIEALGFAAEGPVADSFAAIWQSRYGAAVPRGSLFSFFQRLGMRWHY